MGVLDDLPGIQTLIDADGVAYPSRKKLRVFNALIVDNPVTGETELYVQGDGSGSGGGDTYVNVPVKKAAVDLVATVIAASFNSDPLEIKGKGFSLDVILGAGTAEGTLFLEVSNDPIGSPAAGSWSPLEEAATIDTSTVGSPPIASFEVIDCRMNLARVCFTKASGTDREMTSRATIAE